MSDPRTETVDPRYRDLDRWDSLTALTALWEGQMAAVAAVGAALPALSRAADAMAARLAEGEGRFAYAGAGTSGRVAVADGTELAPTYGWPDARLAFLLAGGEAALTVSVEGAEDDAEGARARVAELGFGPADVLLGIAASGRTPWTVAAVEAARARGALTVGIAGVAGSPLLGAADHAILLETGAEAIAGSTRMKAGTAQKAALTILSTQVMVGLGLVHGGLMVAMQPGNAKLRDRAVGIVARIAGTGREAAEAALEGAGWEIRPAILVARGMEPGEAARRLALAGGRLRDLLDGA
jgi:N-acetylmuramic acid 6-phosphate etherase